MVAMHTTGSFVPQFVHALTRLTAQLPIWGVRHAVCIVEDSLVDRGRDKAVAAMLDGDFTHLLFLDVDISFEPDDVMRLMAAQKPLVAGAYRQRNDSGRFAVSFLPGLGGKVPWDAEAQVMQVDAAGTGFMLIERGVFETMRSASPELAYQVENEDGSLSRLHGFFLQGIVDGQRVTEDILFCRRWRALGGEVWVLPGVRLGHWGRQQYQGMLLEHLTFARDTPVLDEPRDPVPAAEAGDAGEPAPSGAGATVVEAKGQGPAGD